MKVDTLSKKEEDLHPFEALDKSAVIQECRCFNEREIDTGRCIGLITKVLYILRQGERITRDNATNLFFGATKLLQTTNMTLKRLVFLFFRELSPLVSANERIMVTATLVSAISDPKPSTRASAIRVLAHTIDPSMFAGEIERKIKECAVEKDPGVAAAALAAGLYLIKQPGPAADAIKRWTAEITRALQSDSPSVQFQALCLLWQTRRGDRLGVSKMARQLVRVPFRSSHAQCLRIRIMGTVIGDEGAGAKDLLDFVEVYLRAGDDAVSLEAARVICRLTEDSTFLSNGVGALSVMLASTSAPVRLAGIRTLQQVAKIRPAFVEEYNSCLEELMSDQNRSIATLAITTLLQTATETNVEPLMKQISSFVSEIEDEFKVVVVQAMQLLCSKFPPRHAMFMSFLDKALGQQGSQEYKTTAVQCIFTIMETVKESKESGLKYLCEFVEDCEFEDLTLTVLDRLTKEAAEMSQPRLAVRVIYNRVLLEAAPVRAAAVTALGAVACAVPNLRKEVDVLLTRCLHDVDNEVRDRSVAQLHLLRNDNSHHVAALLKPLVADPEALELALSEYCRGSVPGSFDVDDPSLVKKIKKLDEVKPKGPGRSRVVDKTQVDPQTGPAQVGSIPELTMFGQVFATSLPVMLTEADSDFVVSCVKHVFATGTHLALQFEVQSSVQGQELVNVCVDCDVSNTDGLAVVHKVAADVVPAHEPTQTFVVLQRTGQGLGVGSIVNVLKFGVREVEDGEPIGEAFDDEYDIEDVVVSPSDFIKPVPVSPFRANWESKVGREFHERTEVFALQFRTIADGVDGVRRLVGMAACEGTQHYREEKPQKHTLLLAGVFLGGTEVLCKINFVLDQQGEKVHIRVSVKSSQQLCDAVMSCIS